MTESPRHFGPGNALIGVLTRPPQVADPGLAFLLFNAGVLTRIGPHRLNVKLARALAQTKHVSLRFDLSGHGDSRVAIAGGDFREQAIKDLRQAMDHLQQTEGIQRFGLIGFCSGGVHAFDTAVLDERVTGVLMFDGYWYRTRWTVPMRRWRRFRAASWGHALSLAWNRVKRVLLASTDSAAVSLLDESPDSPSNPPRAEFIRSMQGLADRKVATWLVYSGSVIEVYSYENQFRDAFGSERFYDKVRCEFRPDIDHTFLSLEAQQRMTDLVQRWSSEMHAVREVAAA